MAATKERDGGVDPAQGGLWDGLEEMREPLRAFLARHCADENDVEDVIQETFLRAARYRRAHGVQSLRPWTKRIALNVLADAKRRGMRAPAPPGRDEPFDPPAPPAPPAVDSAYRVDELWFDGELARELLLRSMGGLRATDRALLDSYYAGEQGTCCPARECGIPRHLVKVRLYRARQRLLRVLRRRVVHDERWRRCAS